MKENIFHLITKWPAWLQDLTIAIVAILIGVLIKWILSIAAKIYCRKKTGFSLISSIAKHLGPAASIFIPLFILNIAIPLMHFGPITTSRIQKVIGILLIIAFAALLISVIKVVQDYVFHKFDLTKENNLRERKIRTQLQFIRKVAVVLIIILAVIAILLSFENLRRLGAGLLTGVGIGGIIIGFAAQKTLGNLLAGFQIAFTQPIRIDDVLVVEGEWGRVEEINLTYVVLNIWDKRRLVLPIHYFIEKPFQNWTRSTSEILGTVHLFLDYTAPVEAIRQEFLRLVQLHPLWDKKAAGLDVINATERTIELRAVMGAANSGNAWELRCYVREHLLAYIQQNYPGALPRVRTIEPSALHSST